MLLLTCLTFFDSGDCRLFHWPDCQLVSVSQALTQVSSPVMTFKRKLGSLAVCTLRSEQMSSYCCFWSAFTSLAQSLMWHAAPWNSPLQFCDSNHDRFPLAHWFHQWSDDSLCRCDALSQSFVALKWTLVNLSAHYHQPVFYLPPPS